MILATNTDEPPSTRRTMKNLFVTMRFADIAFSLVAYQLKRENSENRISIPKPIAAQKYSKRRDICNKEISASIFFFILFSN